MGATGNGNSTSEPSGYAQTGSSISFLTFDVVNITNYKIKFGVEIVGNYAVTSSGSTASNQTCASFIRLGDT